MIKIPIGFEKDRFKRYNISDISTLKGVFIEWVVLVSVIEKYY